MDIATVVSGWSTGLALLAAVLTSYLTYHAQHEFNVLQISNANEALKEQHKAAIQQDEAQKRSEESQADTAAVEAFRAYFSAAFQAPNQDRAQLLTNYAWFTAETLYDRRGSDPGWQETARGLIVAHPQKIDCGRYSAGFVKWAKSVLPRDPCADRQN